IVRTPGLRREEREAKDRAEELLALCSLAGRAQRFAHSLPYGDQRRLEVARALATEPKLLLLDEPTAGMNPQETADFTGFVQRLRGGSLQVQAGEVVTLIGANGAGKSSTLRSINGVLRPRRGKIRFKGQDITNASPHTIVKAGIAQSPEGRRLFPRMTVVEN